MISWVSSSSDALERTQWDVFLVFNFWILDTYYSNTESFKRIFCFHHEIHYFQIVKKLPKIASATTLRDSTTNWIPKRHVLPTSPLDICMGLFFCVRLFCDEWMHCMWCIKSCTNKQHIIHTERPWSCRQRQLKNVSSRTGGGRFSLQSVTTGEGQAILII